MNISPAHNALIGHLIKEHFVPGDAPLLSDSFEDLTEWHVIDHQTGVYEHVIREKP